MNSNTNPEFDTGKSIEPTPVASASAAESNTLARAVAIDVTIPLIAGETILGKPVYYHGASPFNEKSGFEHKGLCDGPTFTPGTACAYSCTYCYVEGQVLKQPSIRAIRTASGKAFHEVVIRRANAVQKLALDLTRKRRKGYSI